MNLHPDTGVLMSQLSSADSYISFCHNERTATQGHRYCVRTQPLTPYEYEYNIKLDVYQLPHNRPQTWTGLDLTIVASENPPATTIV